MRGIVVVIPARNEARTIAVVVQGLRRAGFEDVTVVDDGSCDGTNKAAGKAGALVVRQPSSKGYTASVIRGMASAIKPGTRHIVTLDGDGAHSPQDVPELVR